MYELVSSRWYSQKSAVISPYPVLVKSSQTFKSHFTKIHYPAIHTHIPSLQAFQPKLFLYFSFPPHPSDLSRDLEYRSDWSLLYRKTSESTILLLNAIRLVQTYAYMHRHARTRAHTHTHTHTKHVCIFLCMYPSHRQLLHSLTCEIMQQCGLSRTFK